MGNRQTENTHLNSSSMTAHLQRVQTLADTSPAPLGNTPRSPRAVVYSANHWPTTVHLKTQGRENEKGKGGSGRELQNEAEMHSKPKKDKLKTKIQEEITQI